MNWLQFIWIILYYIVCIYYEKICMDWNMHQTNRIKKISELIYEYDLIQSKNDACMHYLILETLI